jgi:N-acetylneuraminate synthase
MKIGQINVDSKNQPAIVAEMSGNHNQSLDRAIRLVDLAAESGVQMLKLQTYTADTITIDSNESNFVISEDESPWKGRSFYSLYQEAHTPWEWQKEIIERANSLGLICFSSVFDETSVDFLEDLNIPAYKIASQECIHLPLLEKVASTNKPIIMSTGMASLAEIDEAVNLIRKKSSSEILLMKCTSSYPSSPRNSNVLTIPYLKSIFGCEVGLSDHTLGIGAAIAAVSHGATMIEKHFTFNRDEGGVDSTFSLEPMEMQMLVKETKRAWQALGHIQFGPTESEKVSLSGRRSIYFSEDIKAGEKLSTKNTKVIRPNGGLAPKHYNLILGRRVKSNVTKGTPVSWDLL